MKPNFPALASILSYFLPQDEDQSKITKFFLTSQAERDEEKALADDLLLDDLDLDWDTIDAEVASKT
jgi:hypothetical protein